MMARTESVVVSIGGSILIPGENDAVYISELSKMLKEVSDKVSISIVVGGGKTARYYADVAGKLGGSMHDRDILGIEATRMNAQLLSLSLGDMPLRVPETVEEFVAARKEGSITVMGGTTPGHTTDAVSAMIAEAIGADRIVNATSVDAVYSDDPRKNPDAKRIERMTIAELGEIVYKEHGASKSSVFDPMGVDIAARSGIDILMVDGRDLQSLRNAILGLPFNGTFVDSHRSVPDRTTSRFRNRRTPSDRRYGAPRTSSSICDGCRPYGYPSLRMLLRPS